MTRHLALASTLALAAACGGADAVDGDAGPGGDGADGADEIFARELIEIRIDMDPAMWEEMRLQRKTRELAFGSEDCRNKEIPNPYTWFPATVTVDGEEIPNAGVRKKGHLGSQSTLIPSMKLRFDEFVDGQSLRGLDRLALNNSKADPSYARTCLAYKVFAAAGLPASRCTVAHVVVNGDDLGPYLATEEVAEQYLARNFDRADGNLYEGTANDFRPDAFGGFEQETNQDLDPSRADLLAVMEALEAEDAELRERLDQVVNLDRFIDFWAVESLVWHRDGYAGHANNFYVYADPGDGGRFVFLPWGPDAALHPDARPEVPDSVLAYGVIANRLYAIPAERDRYYARLAAILADDWDPSGLIAEADRMSGIVRPLLPGGGGARNAHDDDLAELTATIEGRRAALEAIIDGTHPDWTEGIRILPCTIPVGPIAGTFITTWDTLDVIAADAGSATIALELDDETIEPNTDGARAGTTAESQDRVQMIFGLPGERRMTLTVNMPHDRWFESYLEPGEHALTHPPAPMSLIYEDLAAGTTIGRYNIGAGTLTFEQIDPTPGGAVRGSFQGTLYLAP